MIDATANLTTPGIRLSIIIQRYKLYYLVKLILPTCACVGFSFAAFGLNVDELLGRLTVVVPSTIALSTLQGYVVATDIPAVAYLAPTTYIVLLFYVIQLLIALESSLLKYWIKKRTNKNGSTCQTKKAYYLEEGNRRVDQLEHTNVFQKSRVDNQEIEMTPRGESHLNQEKQQQYATPSTCSRSPVEKVDRFCWIFLLVIYIVFILLLVLIPMLKSK